jgi:hypothetical protein
MEEDFIEASDDGLECLRQLGNNDSEETTCITT